MTDDPNYLCLLRRLPSRFRPKGPHSWEWKVDSLKDLLERALTVDGAHLLVVAESKQHLDTVRRDIQAAIDLIDVGREAVRGNIRLTLTGSMIHFLNGGDPDSHRRLQGLEFEGIMVAA